jgi:hypothetical protein
MIRSKMGVRQERARGTAAVPSVRREIGRVSKGVDVNQVADAAKIRRYGRGNLQVEDLGVPEVLANKGMPASAITGAGWR